MKIIRRFFLLTDLVCSFVIKLFLKTTLKKVWCFCAEISSEMGCNKRIKVTFNNQNHFDIPSKSPSEKKKDINQKTPKHH